MMEPLYIAGLVATCDQRPLDVINELAEAMAGKVVFMGNELIMKAGEYTAPVLSLGDDDFAGPGVEVRARVPRENLFNEISARLLDRSQNWKEVTMPKVTSSAYVAQDNGQTLPLTNVQFGAIHKVEQAQQVAAVMLRASRQSLTFTARFKPIALPLQVLDTFSLTNARRGWLNKPFEVLARKWSLDGLVEITGVETDPSIYAFGDTFDAVDIAPNSTLPRVTSIEQPQDISVTSTIGLSEGSVVTRTRVSWAATQDASVIQNGKVEIQYIDALTSPMPDDWPAQFEPGSTTASTVVGLIGNRIYLFRVRFVSSSGRVRSPWSTTVSHAITPARSVAGTRSVLAADHTISNVQKTIATIDIQPRAGSIMVVAQAKLKMYSVTAGSNISWQQLTFALSNGASPPNNIYQQVVATMRRDPSKATEYEVFTMTYVDPDPSSPTTGLSTRRYNFTVIGGSTTDIDLIATDSYMTIVG